VLLPQASELAAVDADYRARLTPEVLRAIVALVPDEWLTDESSALAPAERRAEYVQFLAARVAASEVFVQEAQNARHAAV
jgi:hypothetical protein